MRADDLSSLRWVLVLCKHFISTGSCKHPILGLQLHAQVMPPYDCIAKAMSSQQYCCKFSAKGVDFDDNGIR
jgi:hypothetical protein